MIRWKTSVSSNGLGARVHVGYDGGGGEWLMGETIPEFDTNWHLTTGTLSATGQTKTIATVSIYADDYPDTIATGTFQVYYDFILFFKNIFIVPNVARGLEFTPPPRYATIPIPGRVGDVTQNLGSELATVRMSCDLDISDAADGMGSNWKRPQNVVAGSKTDYVNGEVFMEIAHRSYTEPWQWLDTGTEQFKVTLETPVFRRSGTPHILDLLFREHRLSCASNETYYERFGLNL